MAAFKFFNVGKANAEIERLETLLKERDAQIAEFSGNGDEVSAQAETLLAENAKLKSDFAAADGERVKLVGERDKAVAEISSLPEKIKTAAASQAKDIVAGVGLREPVKTTLPENPAADGKAEPKLFGLARVEAAFKKQRTANS